MVWSPPPSLRRFGRPTSLSAARRSVSQLADAMASTLNDVVNKSSTAPIGAHSTKVVQSTQSLSSDPAVAITWASAVFDIDSLWAASPHPTRLTVVTKGIYQITAHVDWTTSGAGDATTALFVNGSQLANDGGRLAHISSGGQSQTETWFAALNATDYVEIFVTRPGGSATTIVASCVAELTGTN